MVIDKKGLLSLLTAIIFAMPLTGSAYVGESPAATDIVYIVDTTGSVMQTDSSHYARDALKLGVDLAPENSRIAIVTTELAEAGLTDVSANEGREQLKGFIDQIQYKNDTDFTLSFDRALGIMRASTAVQKRVIFLGDFSEGGYNMGAGAAETEAVARIDKVVADAKADGVTVDMILWGEAPGASSTAPKLLSVPPATNGELITLPDASRAPACIEDIYFQNYEYQTLALSVRGQAEQTFDIPMPTANVRRARIYVSAQNPSTNFGASYSDDILDGEQNRSYSMVDLTAPSPEGVKLTLTPGASGSATIYTLLEYDPLSLSVSLDNRLLDGMNEYGAAQSSTIHAEIVDEQTGTPLLPYPYPEDASYTITVTAPDSGDSIPHTQDDPTSFAFSPDLDAGFGAYQVAATLKIGEITFGPLEASVTVPDLRPLPEPPAPPPNWPLIVAIAIAGALVLAGLIAALRVRKREVEYQGAVEMASDYHFHGKLSVYAVILEAGEREIRPFDFALHTIGEKRITLRSILDSVGARDAYPGAEDILFLVGPEESVVMRNNSKAIIRIMGRTYEHRSKAQIFYDQKCYIIFDQNENELELIYRKVRNEDTARPVNFTFQARQTHAQNG